MKKFGIIAVSVVATLSMLIIAFGLYVQHTEEQQLAEIERLAAEGEYIKGFNLAQEMLDAEPLVRVQAQALYWQSYCLYKKGESQEATAKIGKMVSVDPDYDRMSKDETFQQFYLIARRLQGGQK